LSAVFFDLSTFCHSLFQFDSLFSRFRGKDDFDGAWGFASLLGVSRLYAAILVNVAALPAQYCASSRTTWRLDLGRLAGLPTCGHFGQIAL
jgi:hypothetical protein